VRKIEQKIFTKEGTMPPIIINEKCNACGICADICPTDVFRVAKKKEIPEIRYPEECWHCNSCVLDCKQEAIELRIPLPAMMLYVEAGSPAGKK
jgi:adenylylsulfate reductase subunit B